MENIKDKELPDSEYKYMTVSDQNRISILNMQAELLTINTKIDKILEVRMSDRYLTPKEEAKIRELCADLAGSMIDFCNDAIQDAYKDGYDDGQAEAKE